MKSSRKFIWLLSGLGLAAALEHIETGNPLEAIFYKTVTVRGAAVQVERPPAETQAELSRRITAAPRQADLYALRALEHEKRLDPAAAERDWVEAARLDADAFAAQTALADFYHRRIEPAKELAALERAVAQPAKEDAPPIQQKAWKTFERMQALIAAHLLGYDTAKREFEAWAARYPAQKEVYALAVDNAVAAARFDDAARWAERYRAAVPGDETEAVKMAARIAAARGDARAALAVYESRFRPLWPDDLLKAYFELLAQNGGLRGFLASARARRGTLDGAARIFYYWRNQGDMAQAVHALTEFERGAGAQDLVTLGQLYEVANDADHAAQSYYSLYARNIEPEETLARLASLLLRDADQPIRIGSGDLTYFRDIAQADPYPGHLNGILSLILNSTGPQWAYSEQTQNAQPYFRRAKAAELVSLFEKRFPNSPRLPGLVAERIEAYAAHGASDAVLRAAAAFRAKYPNAPERTHITVMMADAYARQNRTLEEFAAYDTLLGELATKAGGVPIGERRDEQQGAAREPEYARILDRYLARLVSFKQLPDALALYRREIDRNPIDPGLYERFAGFLEQNKLGADVAATFRRAMGQFQSTAWSHKLARWYLRQKQTAEYTALSRDVISRFSGTDLESYFREVAPKDELGDDLYRQLNLYAHRRFPHDLQFTRNLIGSYAETSPEFEALLRANWFRAGDVRSRYFEYLSRTRKLDAELAALGSINDERQVNANPVAARMLADGEVWRTHYEAAAPVYRLLSASYPSEEDTTGRAVSLYRSLATVDARNAETAASLAQRLTDYRPTASEHWTVAGEIWADRERFDRAAAPWSRIVAIEPGVADRYLETATLFWDYYRFDDALRTIGDGRRALRNPVLFAYQAGAIFENRREYDRAITEYASAVMSEANGQAEDRLVQLASRPALSATIDKLTREQAEAASARMEALDLRVRVLESQSRRGEIEPFLTALAARTQSFDTLDWIEKVGREQGIAKAQESAMLRRAAITPDAVDRLRYQLALGHFYEDEQRISDARGAFEAALKANPSTLGAVRAATDFYWRRGEQKLAVATLTAAAGRAQPEFQKALRFEAAHKATEAGDTAPARQLLALLMKDEPFKPEYLTAMAATYEAAKDDRGLRTFFTESLRAIGEAPLAAAVKQERAAGLRRGLIAVLTRMSDFSAGVDQYIELLNRYPADEQLTREAARYAREHAQGDRLLAWYGKTAAASPRDGRWPVVIARIQTEFENFPAAADAYTAALAIQPERQDLWMARANMEERLLRFAGAEQAYTKLYELAYHAPEWMERVAQSRARQGDKAGALAALKAAYVDGRPARWQNTLAMARVLEGWNYLAEARQFAADAASQGGDELLNDRESAAVYARVMVRARRPEALNAATASDAIGAAVREFYTPEEKAAFAVTLESRGLDRPVGLAIARAAGFEDLAAKWQLAAVTEDFDNSYSHFSNLVESSSQRLRYQALAAQLERLSGALPPSPSGRPLLTTALAQAYRMAGDAAGEIRTLNLTGAQANDRFCQVLATEPKALLDQTGARQGAERQDFAANCAVQYGAYQAARTAIASRGAAFTPVWRSSYVALAGLYFGVVSPDLRGAFTTILGSAVIGDRLGKPTDRDRQLAGEPWFYYGSRFADYLTLAKEAGNDDYLASEVEGDPWDAEAYRRLGDAYRDAGNVERAAVEYRHAIELDPDRAMARDSLAELLWAAGNKQAAAAEYRSALAALDAMQERGKTPPEFGANVKTLLAHLGQKGLTASLRPHADRLLKTWIKRNGTYMFEPFLEGIVAASRTPADAARWLVDLSQSANDPLYILANAARSSALPFSERDALLEKLIATWRDKSATSFGAPREMALNELGARQKERLTLLVQNRQAAAAQAVLKTMTTPLADDLIPLEIQVAAANDGLAALIERYRSSAQPPSNESLLAGGNALRAAGMAPAARRILEYLYTRELDLHHFDGANFLGLASIRIEDGDRGGAVTLLRRMTMLAGEPFANHRAAAELLERNGVTQEAALFWSERLKAAPWDTAARARVAALAGDKQQLSAAVSETTAPYQERVAAALALRGAGGAVVAGAPAELALLASSAALTEALVNRPYWYHARVEAARAAQGAVKTRLLAAALAVDPNADATRLAYLRSVSEPLKQAGAFPKLDAQDLEWRSPETFLEGSVYTDAERAEIARTLGGAWLRLGEPRRAMLFYRMARGATAEMAAAERQVKLKQQNDARRPVVSARLEQPNVVRPMLKEAR